MCHQIWGKKFLFFGKFSVLCFLETPVLRFAHLPYYQRSILPKKGCMNQQYLIKSNTFTEKEETSCIFHTIKNHAID